MSLKTFVIVVAMVVISVAVAGLKNRHGDPQAPFTPMQSPFPDHGFPYHR